MTGIDARILLASLAKAGDIPADLWLDFEIATTGEAALAAFDVLAGWGNRLPAGARAAQFAEAIGAIRAEKKSKAAVPPVPDPGAEHPKKGKKHP